MLYKGAHEEKKRGKEIKQTSPDVREISCAELQVAD